MARCHVIVILHVLISIPDQFLFLLNCNVNPSSSNFVHQHGFHRTGIKCINLFKEEGGSQAKLMNVKYFCKKYMFHCNREGRGINSIARYKGTV